MFPIRKQSASENLLFMHGSNIKSYGEHGEVLGELICKDCIILMIDGVSFSDFRLLFYFN